MHCSINLTIIYFKFKGLISQLLKGEVRNKIIYKNRRVHRTFEEEKNYNIRIQENFLFGKPLDI